MNKSKLAAYPAAVSGFGSGGGVLLSAHEASAAVRPGENCRAVSGGAGSLQPGRNGRTAPLGAGREPAFVLLRPDRFFPLYRWTLKTDLSRALAVYVGVCAIETFPSQMSTALDVYLYPEIWFPWLSAEAFLLQMALSLLLLAAAWIIRRRLVWVIDQLDFPKVWYSTVPLSGVFLVLNDLVAPGSLEFYQADQTYRLYPLLQICLLALLICIYVLYYQGTRLMWEQTQSAQRTQLLEMQSHQYQALQEHMRQTARLRHDFRHSIRLLSALAEEENLAGIRTHLTEYERRLAEHSPAVFCANAALNALFGYYYELAVSAGVDTNWKIELPNPLTVSELDLAGLFGNLLENGIKGCQTLPDGVRRFSLTTELRPGGSLYIVSTNTFDGHIRKGQGGYYSTRHDGHGIGLKSIAAVAEKYGGSVRFSHCDTEFFVDVVMKV